MNALELKRAAQAVAQAEALVIAAGAGMGVDSGLPDFRGTEGFWRAYPALARRGLRFEQLANPSWFERDPAMAWGFYGHRRNLYRTTAPHAGFGTLKRWGESMPRGYFVVTSNVDHYFQRAGYLPERIYEIHGSLEFEQCAGECGVGVFEAASESVTLDEETMRAQAPLPTCPGCGRLARPNVLMFGDWQWDSRRTSEQSSRFREWLHSVASCRITIIECGAGTAVPSIRLCSRELAEDLGATVIRINPREFQVEQATHVAIALSAREALTAIDDQLKVSAVSW